MIKMTAFDKAWKIVKFSDDPEKLREWGERVKEYHEEGERRGFRIIDHDMEKPVSWDVDEETGMPIESISECSVEVCDRFSPDGGVCEKCADIAYSHGPGSQKENPNYPDERICDYGDETGECMKPSVGVNAGEGSASWLCEEHWNEHF
tara:strand:+ start:9222 stop:9668 length:447 start_codon:yes stop_codon:yes gene_type:complete